MGKKKQEDPPAGSPAWMATFSDLMNLLLCFFVLLFSMSTVDAEKFEIVINSFQEAFSILPSGGATLTEGVMISSGISQLPEFANYFGDTMSSGDGDGEIDAGDLDEEGQEPPGGENEGQGKSDQEIMQEAMEELVDQIQQEKLSESESMAEKIEALATQYGIQDMIEVDFNGQYVRITMNGALLFDSGQSELRSEAIPLVEKLSKVLNIYGENLIEVDGHTDNVPIHSAKYEDNDVLSMYRALSVANMIRSNTSLDPAHIVSAGRGEYEPVADNSTAEGRARNRRVEIKIYNTFDENEMEVEADGSTEMKPAETTDTDNTPADVTVTDDSSAGGTDNAPADTTPTDNTSLEETINEEESVDNSDTGSLPGESDTDGDNGVRSSTGSE
ncbi:MAG: flagellar motor protein MotB [Lachnospiraceae bacterium]|nr:flagellar motor protein MotB [Lachnospiraceae bacterium]